MKMNRTGSAAIVLILGLACTPLARANGAPQGPPPGYGQDRGGWEAPPQAFDPIRRQGFHDGIEGARKDFENHRQPNVNNRDEYRHPSLPPDQRRAYRDGFRRGYNMGVSHLMNGGPGRDQGPVYQAPRGSWDMAPNEFNDIQRQGFHDGMVGAQRDFENHRQPNVENRDEYRNPHLPYEQRETYRAGFRRGYDRAMDHLMGRPYQY